MKKVTAMLFSMAVGLNAVSMAAKAKASEEQETDVLLIGGGIMSATLGTYLRELEPEWSMTMVERLEGVAQESSNGWNNAGTGHSALMELNYTPQNADGSISIEKAVAINEAFQISRQFWAHQVERGVLRTPRSFINTVPHMSFVWGEDNVNFLRARYGGLSWASAFPSMTKNGNGSPGWPGKASPRPLRAGRTSRRPCRPRWPEGRWPSPWAPS